MKLIPDPFSPLKFSFILLGFACASCHLPARDVYKVDNRVPSHEPQFVYDSVYGTDVPQKELNWGATFCPTGKSVLLARTDGLYEWVLEDPARSRYFFRTKFESVNAAHWSANGQLIAATVGSVLPDDRSENFVIVLDAASGGELYRIAAADGYYPKQLAFSPDGQLLAWAETSTKTGRSEVVLRSMDSGQTARFPGLDGRPFKSHPIALFPQEHRAGWYGAVWDLKADPAWRLDNRRTLPFPVFAYAPDGRRGYVMAPRHRHEFRTSAPLRGETFAEALYELDLGTGEILARRDFVVPKTEMRTTVMATSGNGRLLAVATTSAAIHIIDLVSNRDLGKLIGLPLEAFAVSFSPDSQYLAACTTTRVCVWRVPRGGTLGWKREKGYRPQNPPFSELRVIAGN